MAIVEDCSSASDGTEEELDEKVYERIATSAATQMEVRIKCCLENNEEKYVEVTVFYKALTYHY